MKKRLLSGVKPTGRPHIGNYFGAMKQFVDMQDDHDAHIFIANYHALTGIQDAKQMHENTIDMAIDYLAIGLNPEKTILFKQSDVPQVTELGWIFNCITTMPYLMRAHSFKDAEAKNKDINVGTFDYPVLMAADILIQDADIVPVGADQKQHIEYARDIAEKFNRTYGETFKLPNDHIIETVKTVPGTDGQKMSKSYGNTIPLFATLDEITKAVMSIPTDSTPLADPKPKYKEDTVYMLHELFTPMKKLNEVEDGYKNGGYGYGDSKKDLIENIDAYIAPMREKRAEIAKDTDMVTVILEEGGKKAREYAEKKMEDVRAKVGI